MIRKWAFLALLLPSFSYAGNLISSATWSESGNYKMAREDYAPGNISSNTINYIWNGTTITLAGAKGELLSWKTYVIAGNVDATGVMVKIDSFTGVGTAAGSGFSAVAVSSANVWDYSQRPYSLYKLGCLRMPGMNKVDQAWDAALYDAQQLPPRFRYACTQNGNNQCVPNGATELWANLPDHDKNYPDINIPMEVFAISSFTVAHSSSQAIGGEIYVSTSLPAGHYLSHLNIYEGITLSTSIPIDVNIYNVTMPAAPSMPILADLGIADLASRLNGNRNPANYYVDPYLTSELRAEAFLHRHRITTIGDQPPAGQNFPSVAYQKHIDGSAFTETYGLSANTGPGYGIPDSIYMAGTYGAWVSGSWSTGTVANSSDFCVNASSWAAYCAAHGLDCELYTPLDETDQTNLAGEVQGIGVLLNTSTSCVSGTTRLKLWQTGDLPIVASSAPAVNTVASTAWLGASSTTWQTRETFYQASSTHSVWGYNSGLGTDSLFAIQEEGLGPREVMWGAYKTGQKGWFEWEIDYWNDVNSGGQIGPPWNSNVNGDTNMYSTTTAKDFGYDNFPSTDATLGHTGFNFAMGDGNMLYYGTDAVFANPNYGINAVFGSWRLDMLTKGSQDVDLIKLAFAVNPSSTTAIVNAQVQDVMFLRGPFDPADPSYSYGPRPWSESLDSWESQHEALLQIAAGGASPTPPGAPANSISGGGGIKGGGGWK